jgi:glyoxylase-like metal-dependent hydrolase (beta-lactamase superfamily II)
MQIISTPGHTPGSLCVLSGSGDDTPLVCITGDTLFIGNVGRTDLPESSVNSMLQSLKRLSTLPENTIVLPGHNYATETQSTIGQEKKRNPWMQKAEKVGNGILRSNVIAQEEFDFERCRCCMETARIVVECIESHESSLARM